MKTIDYPKTVVDPVIAEVRRHKQEKTTLYYTLIACLALTVIGCNSQERKDKVAIREAVAEISKTPLPRKPDESKTHTIHTSKGALSISTCEGNRGLNGEIYTEGPSRANGFFLIPRMEWVNDAKEAERLLIEDYEKGNCQQFKEIEIRPATNKPEAEPGGAGQPATVPESKPEGQDKPQPESKPTPR